LTLALAAAGAGAAFAITAAWSVNPDASRSQRVFQSCAACHSLKPDQNMTGPSLAGLWNRKAGSLASFARYSDALKSSNIVWNDKTLDEWIEDPQRLVPGNDMPFAGIKNTQQRADLLAFLKQATQAGHAPAAPAQGGQMGGMTGGGGGGVPNLKKLNPNERVQKVTHCRDTYKVTTVDGKTRAFWERNLRLKTDSSNEGPDKGAPALMGAGMMGDRADVIFSTPDEISGFIKDQCGAK
jgi:cytochrome c